MVVTSQDDYHIYIYIPCRLGPYLKRAGSSSVSTGALGRGSSIAAAGLD